MNQKPFNPVYLITNKMLHHLTTIAASVVAVENAPLIPKWEVSIRRDALLRNAHASTAIEGNPLSFEEVSELADGKLVMIHRKARDEVLNYLTVLEIMPNLARKSINSDLVLNIHSRLMNSILPSDELCGQFRHEGVVVGNSITHEVIFRPPKAKNVPRLIEKLIYWINTRENVRNPVLEAGIVHYEIVRIHPFIDGNGRTARAMASLILYKRGFDSKRFFALDDYYDNDRKAYYDALNTVDPQSCDLTKWLEYFTEGVMIQIERVKKKVFGLSPDFQKKERFGQIALDERQMKIVEYINQNRKITNREIQKILDVAPRTAVNIIGELVDLNVVKTEGKGRGLHYVIS